MRNKDTQLHGLRSRWRAVVVILVLAMVGGASFMANAAIPISKASKKSAVKVIPSDAPDSLIEAWVTGRDARALVVQRKSSTAPLNVTATPPVAPRAFGAYTTQLEQLRVTLRTAKSAQQRYPQEAARRQLNNALAALPAHRLLLDARLEQVDQALMQSSVPSLARSRWTEQRAQVLARIERIEAAARSLAQSLVRIPEQQPVPQALFSELDELLASENALAQPAVYGVNLPVFRPRLAPRGPSMTPLIAPTYADSEHENLPAPEDFLASVDAPLSPAILAQAASLGHDYTRILDFVRSQVRTQWYAGSQKGAAGTLRSLAGNDVDQASLLIALLRASGAPARYVRGVVQIPVDDLVSMLGVRADKVGLALSAAGVANRPIAGGGHIAAYTIEQVYVSAHLPLSNYRGSAADLAGRTWVPLAPALKPHQFRVAAGALASAGLSVTDFIQQFLASPQLRAPLDLLRERLGDVLAQQSPPREYTNMLSQQVVDAAPLELLPTSLPYVALATTAEFAQLPDDLRQQAHFIVHAGDSASSAVALDRTVALSQLIGQRVTLSYTPASIDDGRIADRHGGLGATPPSLLHVRPMLSIAGLPSVQGTGEIENAATHRIEIELTGPGGSVALSQLSTAGGLAAIVFDAQTDQPPEQADDVTLPGESESKAARILANFGARYLSTWDVDDDELARLIGVGVMRPFPAVAFVLNQYQVDRLGGVVDAMNWTGVALDAALRPVEPFAQGDNATAEVDWTQLSALQGSFLEHELFEQQWLVESISADKGLGLARSRNLPILNLTAATGTSELRQSPTVIENIAGWLARGFLVEVPRDPLTLEAWTGAVWRVTSASTGESGYFIAGALAGGATAMPPRLWYFQDLASLLANPYNLDPNEDPLSAVALSIDASAQFQEGIAGTELGRPLSALLLDAIGRPVAGAQVQFSIDSGTARLLDEHDAEATQLIAITNRSGVANIRVKLGTRQGGTGNFRQLEGQQFPQWIGMSVVEVRATTTAGVLYAGEPYRVFTLPAAPAKLIFRGDATRPLFPGISYRAFLAQVTDEFDNEVSNVSVSLSSATRYEAPQCGNADPQHVDTIDASLFTPGDCPVETVRMTGNACTRPGLTTLSRPTGAPFMVAPPATALATVDIVGNAGTGARSMTMHTDDEFFDACNDEPVLAAIGWVHNSTNGYLPWLDDNLNPVIDAARPGELIPVPLRADILRAVLTAGDHAGVTWTPVSNATFVDQLDNGSLENLRELPGGVYLQDLRAGPVPGPIRGSIMVLGVGSAFALSAGKRPAESSNGTQPSAIHNDIFGWSVDPRLPLVSPTSIPLTAFGATDVDIHVENATIPEDYVSAPGRIELLQGGALLGECSLPQMGKDAYCDFGRGILIDIHKSYSTRTVLNDGTPFVMASATLPLKFGLGIVAGYGILPRRVDPPGPNSLPGNLRSDISDDLLLLQNHFPTEISIQDHIDVPSGYACTTGARLGYLLSQEARITLTFYKLDAQGNPSTTEAWKPIDDALQSAGLHDLQVTAANLGYGDFVYKLKAIAADGKVEEYSGVAAHHAERRDAMPLAHDFVQGVDLFHGGAIVNEDDIVIGGRGPGMKLSRTYASHNGNEIGFFGRGWSADLDSQVVVDDCDTRIVTGSEGQGMRFAFVGPSPDGGLLYRPLQGFHGSLVQHGGSYDFYTTEGTRHHFAQVDVRGPRLSYVEDTNGNRVSYAYELNQGKPHVTRISDAAGRHIDLDYVTREVTTQQSGFALRDSVTLVTSAAGPGGLRMNYDYDAAGNLIGSYRWDGTSGSREHGYTVRDLGGALSADPTGAMVYTHFGFRLTRVTDLLDSGQRSIDYQLGWSAIRAGDQGDQILYLPEQRVVSVTEPQLDQQFSTTFVYEQLRGLDPVTTHVTDARGNVTHYGLNRYGATESKQDFAGTTTTAWDLQQLQPRTKTDGLGTLTTFDYDDAGNTISETIAHLTAGTVQRSWTFYAATDFEAPFIKNRVKTAVDGNGHTTTHTYDARGNRTSTTRGGITDRTTYQPNGDPSSHTDGRSKTWLHRTDNYGYAREIEDPLHAVTRSQFDERGRLREETDANGAKTSRTYDARDRVLSTTYPATEAGVAVHTMVYNDRDHFHTDINPRQNRTETIYDRMGRLLQVFYPDHGTRELNYDASGNLLKDTDHRGNPTVFAYDATHRLIDRYEPEVQRCAGVPGAGCTLVSEQRHTHYEHDALGHVIRETVSTATGTEPRVTETRYEDPLYRRTHVRKWLHGPSGDRWVEEKTEYDGAGNVVKRIDALQRETVYTYDERDRLRTQTEPLGKVTTFDYDGADHKIEVRQVNPSGSGEQVRRWIYDDAGRLNETVDATGAHTVLELDAVGNIKARRDALQHRTQTTYDARRRPVIERGAEAGQLTTYHYDLNGNRVGEDWANGRVLTHRYDAMDRRDQTRDALGIVEERLYDFDGNVERLTDANGHVTRNVYDALQRLTHQELPSIPSQPRHVFTVHTIHNEIIQRADPGQHVTSNTYDSLGRKTATTLPSIDGSADTLRTEYDDAGNAIRDIDARGNVTSYTVNALNRRIGQTDPANDAGIVLHQIWTYDEIGNAIHHTDRQGVIALTAYDRENREVGHFRDGLLLDVIERDAVGNIVELTDAKRFVTTSIYDKANRKVEERRTDANGVETRQTWTYTPLGDVATQTNPDLHTTVHTYTLRRYPETDTTNGETTTYTVDGLGQRLSSQRPNSTEHTWFHTYDAADRLATVTDPLSHATTYTYDPDGNRTATVDANQHRTAWVFDARHRTTDKTWPTTNGETAHESWTYDANNNVLTNTRPNGQVFTHRYDALNRHVEETITPSIVGQLQRTTWTYDGNGNPTEIVETLIGQAPRTETRHYDAFDRLDHVRDVEGRELTYTYDANGNRTSLTNTLGTAIRTDWSYDPLNRNVSMTTTGQGTTTLDYFPSGLLKKITRPTGATSETAYDAAGRIASISHANAGSPISTITYRYDLNGNRIEQKETNGAVTGNVEQTTTYVYDKADRLTATHEIEAGGPRTTTYTLDPVGNRSRETVTNPQGQVVSDSTLTYNDRDQLTQRSDPVANVHVGLTYDTDGNTATETITGSPPRIFSYDARDRLVTLAQPGAPPLSFDYSNGDLRLCKTQGAAETKYQYDGSSLLAETNAIGNPTARYHYSATQLLSRTDEGSSPGHRHYLLDALQTPIALLTQAGAIDSRTRFDAWGEVITQQGSDGQLTTPNRDAEIATLPQSDNQPVGYTGYIKDSESGLYYAKARYYDPAIARFTTEDPEAGKALTPPSLHRYLYAYANPTVYTDPNGRRSVAEQFMGDNEGFTDGDVYRRREETGYAFLDAAGRKENAGTIYEAGKLTAVGLYSVAKWGLKTLGKVTLDLGEASDIVDPIVTGVQTVAGGIRAGPEVWAAHYGEKSAKADALRREGRYFEAGRLYGPEGAAVAGGTAALSRTLVAKFAQLSERGAAATIVEGTDGKPAAQFYDPAAVAELSEAYRAAGRGIDVKHSPQIKVPFGQGIGKQGFAYENQLAAQMPSGTRLPPNFKTFDFFDDASREAVSAKTLDTTSPSRVAEPSRVYSAMRRSADAAADFEGYMLERRRVLPEQIDLRAVRVAVPLETNATQWGQIKRAIDYAKERGIRLDPEVVKNSSAGH